MIVDPDRADRAIELLVNAQTEDELFRDLEAQYGEMDAARVEQQENMSRQQQTVPVTSVPSSSSKRKAAPKAVPKAAPKKSLPTPEEDDMSDFIVSDSEEDEPSEDEEESEFEEDESEIEEPEPDEDLAKRRRLSPKTPLSAGPPPARPPIATRLPPGPTIICKYGKACYRKNPVHFQEFAHPWLLNPPS